ncbi:glycosyltransferase family 39 protein [Pseudomonadota bacterium]
MEQQNKQSIDLRAPNRNTTVRRYLVLIVVLCAIVRLVHYQAVVQSAFVDFPLYASQTDMFAFWQWSDTIVMGDWLGRDTYHPQMGWMAELGDEETWHRWWGDERIFQQEPVYPYLIAIGRSLGLSISALILIQLLIGSLQPVVTFWLSRLVFLQDGPALIAAAIAGLYGPLIFNQSVLLRDWTGPLLESLGLIALLHALWRDRSWAWVWPGIVFGLALMTRSAILVFLPFMIFWIIWVNRGSILRITRRGSILATGLLVGFSPILVRNILVGVSPLKITNRLPEAIVFGNAADVNPLGMMIPPSLPGILEKAEGSALVAAIESFRTYQGDWLSFLSMQWLKFQAVLDPFELPNNLSFTYGKEISPVLRILPDYGLILPFGVLGLILIWVTKRFDQKHGLIVLYGVSGLLGLFATAILGRYRLGIAPFLFLYSGWAIWQLWHWSITRQYGRFALLCAILAGLVVVQQLVVPIQSVRQSAFAMCHPLSYHTASHIYLARNRIDLAIDEWARMQLRGEKIGAAQCVDDAAKQQQTLHLELAIYFERTDRSNLADLHLAEIDRLFDQRTDSPLRNFALGMAALRLGRTSTAVERLEQFVEEHPDHLEAEKARQLISEIYNDSIRNKR